VFYILFAFADGFWPLFIVTLLIWIEGRVIGLWQEKSPLWLAKRFSPLDFTV